TLDDLPLGNGERGLDPPRGKHAVGVVMVVAGQADLLQVVHAGQPGHGDADLLDGGEQQADEDGNNGDDDEQLDQREAASAIPAGVGASAGHEMNPPRDERPPYFPSPPASRAAACGSGGACQIFTVPSRLAEATHLPSGLKATAWTQL